MNRSCSTFAWLLVAVVWPRAEFSAAPLDVERRPRETTSHQPSAGTTDSSNRPTEAKPENAAGPAASQSWLEQPFIKQARDAMLADKIAEGDEFLRQAVNEDPSLPPAELLAAYLHLADNRMPAAQRALELAGAQHKTHPEVYLAFARVAMMENRSTDAWVHFEKAMKLAPPKAWSSTKRTQFTADCLAGLANIAERRQDWGAAEVLCQRLSQLVPRDTDVLTRWARMLLLTGNPASAFEKLSAATKLDGRHHPPELSLAALYVELGKPQEARKWYEKAITQHPDDSRVYFEYGSALLLTGDAAAAAQQIDKAVEVGTHVDELKEHLSMVRGYLARSQRNYEQAEQIFTELLGNSPGHFQALSQLPLALAAQDDMQKRQRALQLAVILAQKHPQSPHAWSTLGNVQFRLGQYEEAEKSLRRAARSLSGDGDTLFVLAQVLLAQSEVVEAENVVNALRVAVAQPGPFVERSAAEAWLQDVALAFPIAP